MSEFPESIKKHSQPWSLRSEDLEKDIGRPRLGPNLQTLAAESDTEGKTWQHVALDAQLRDRTLEEEQVF